MAMLVSAGLSLTVECIAAFQLHLMMCDRASTMLNFLGVLLDKHHITAYLQLKVGELLHTSDGEIFGKTPENLSGDVKL